MPTTSSIERGRQAIEDKIKKEAETSKPMSKNATIRPIQKNILVEPVQRQSTTKGGIYIPEAVDPNAKGVTKGRIVAMAEDVDVRRLHFKIGMIIMFNKFAYTEIKVPSFVEGEVDKLFYLIKEDKVDACIDG